MINVIFFSPNGEEIYKKLLNYKEYNFSLFSGSDYKIWLKSIFCDSEAIIFIGAVSIAVRLIKDLIKSKDIDPAVLVIDDRAKFVIPILSGHLGGANKIAADIAGYLGSIPVITTATDLNNKFAVDLWSKYNDSIIENIENIKYISSAVLKNKPVGFYSDFEPFKNFELPDSLYFSNEGELGICLSLDNNKKPFNITLNVIPKLISIGVGCRKNTDYLLLKNFIEEEFLKLNISLKSIRELNSIDLKKNEECLIKFSKENNIDFKTYSKEELNNVRGNFTSSKFVEKTVGVDNVCERAASITGGELILKKTKKDGITLAIAKKDWKYRFFERI